MNRPELNVSPAVRPEMKLAKRSHFLEHVSFTAQRESTPIVLCANDTLVHVSHDLGCGWKTHSLGHLLHAPVTRSFTLRNGNRVLQTSRGGVETLLVDPDFQVIARSRQGTYNWHGTWSIDESITGIVMYGEYDSHAEAVSIWRSGDGGRSWERIFTLRGLNAEEPDARHFHVCQADPYARGRWLVSTGDARKHCRIWLSSDDGETWSEASDPNDPDASIKPRDRRRVYRFTSLMFREKSILWVTDDTLGLGKAALVIVPGRDLAAARVFAQLGRNEMRSLTLLDDGRAVATSESKLDVAVADVFLIDHNLDARLIGSIENKTRSRTGFSRSLCSRMAHEGTFFSYDDGGVVDPDCRFARWRIAG